MIYFLIFYCVFSFIFMLGFSISIYDDYFREDYSYCAYTIITLLAPITFPFLLGIRICNN